MDTNGTLTTLVIMSKTGSGKSSLANTLFDSKDFAVGNTFDSETKQCHGQMKFARSRHLLVVDTPGLMDVQDPTMPQRELLNALNNCPTGVDAFIFVIRGDCRFNNDEYQAIKQSVDVFGPESHKRAIVVFSHADHFDWDVNEFKAILTRNRASISGLDEMLNKFGNRFVLMDNGKRSDVDFNEKQVVVLLQLIEADKKKKQSDEEYIKTKVETAEMKAQVDGLRLQLDLMKDIGRSNSHAQQVHSVQQYVVRRDGYAPVTELLSDFGNACGAVLASPFAGAAGLLNWATS